MRDLCCRVGMYGSQVRHPRSKVNMCPRVTSAVCVGVPLPHPCKYACVHVCMCASMCVYACCVCGGGDE